jgi:cytochrome c oxidase subunit III
LIGRLTRRFNEFLLSTEVRLGIDIEETVETLQNPAPPHPPVTLKLIDLPSRQPERSETGVWIAISAIVMCFAALTSAMIVRQGVSSDWVHFSLPRILYATTAILLGSTLTLMVARHKLSIAATLSRSRADGEQSAYREGITWLHVTLALGGLFVIGQILAWRILAAEGLFLSTNPSSAFFYVLTAGHALHLLGGLVGLIYMLNKLSKTNGTAATTGLPAFCLYWHFMDGLWVYLFVLLLART